MLLFGRETTGLELAQHFDWVQRWSDRQNTILIYG